MSRARWKSLRCLSYSDQVSVGSSIEGMKESLWLGFIGISLHCGSKVMAKAAWLLTAGVCGGSSSQKDGPGAEGEF